MSDSMIDLIDEYIDKLESAKITDKDSSIDPAITETVNAFSCEIEGIQSGLDAYNPVKAMFLGTSSHNRQHDNRGDAAKLIGRLKVRRAALQSSSNNQDNHAGLSPREHSQSGIIEPMSPIPNISIINNNSVQTSQLTNTIIDINATYQNAIEQLENIPALSPGDRQEAQALLSEVKESVNNSSTASDKNKFTKAAKAAFDWACDKGIETIPIFLDFLTKSAQNLLA